MMYVEKMLTCHLTISIHISLLAQFIPYLSHQILSVQVELSFADTLMSSWLVSFSNSIYISI